MKKKSFIHTVLRIQTLFSAALMGLQHVGCMQSIFRSPLIHFLHLLNRQSYCFSFVVPLPPPHRVL